MLFLATALSLGIEATYGLGEVPPAFLLRGEGCAGRVYLQGDFSTMRKYTGGGFIAKGTGRMRIISGFHVLGAFTHRDGGPWTKQVLWVGGGWRRNGLTATAERALTGTNGELKLAGSLRGTVRGLTVESELFVERFKQAGRPMWGGGVALRVGWETRKGGP